MASLDDISVLINRGCNEDQCEHVFDGEFIQTETVGSASCSRCGMLEIDHDIPEGRYA